MLNKLRVRVQEEKGFTLVELLVVMLILGLLAAIAIPSFFNQRDKARDADAKASVRTAQTAMETYATDNGGSYVGATAADLITIENTLTGALPDDPQLEEPTNLASNTYTVTVQSTNTPNEFSITRNSNGTVDLTCTVVESDGCPAGGEWD
ncbi:MAG: type IV pilin protein [Solirubrobacterales bacterium]